MDKNLPEDRFHFIYYYLAESYIYDKEWDKAKEALERGLQAPKDRDVPSQDDEDYKNMEKLLKKVNDKLE